MIFLAFFNIFSGIFYANLPEVFFVETNTFIHVMLVGVCMTFLDKPASRTLFFWVVATFFSAVTFQYVGYVEGAKSLLPQLSFAFISALFGGMLVGLLLALVFYFASLDRRISLAVAWAVTMFINLPLVSFILTKMAT